MLNQTVANHSRITDTPAVIQHVEIASVYKGFGESEIESQQILLIEVKEWIFVVYDNNKIYQH